jgi:hypothetical protein
MWSIDSKYDVIIAGGGVAGWAAAIAASEAGAKVLLVEKESGPGGVATFSGCPVFMGFGETGKQCIGGLGECLMRRLDAIHALADSADGQPLGDRPVTSIYTTTEPQLMLVLNRMLKEAKVDLLYYTMVSGVRCTNGMIEALELFFCGEKTTVRAPMYIDATGDAVIAAMAGCPVNTGATEDSMTKTVLFKVNNVSSFDKPDLRRRFSDICRAGRFPYKNQDLFMGSRLGQSDEVLLNMSLAVGNAMNPHELTAMDIELREQIFVILDWLRHELPEFKNCKLVNIAPKIGVRAGRNIIGRENITCEDLINDAPVSEPVAVGRRWFGGHGINSFASPWEKGVHGWRSVPYGALKPQNIDNLLVCGRAIGVETRAITAIRYLSSCMATGQAAGAAAAISARNGSSPPYSLIKDELLKQNAILTPPE